MTLSFRRAAAVVTCVVAGLVPTVLTGPAASAAPASEPGALLSSSPLAEDLLPDGAASGTLVRYSTLRTAGQVGESTGLVFVPEGETPAGGWPVVSFAHGTTGVADACTPSLTGGTEYERPAITEWLRNGYAVAATDYAGLGTPGVHAYLDGPASGANVVDIVRTAHRLLGDELSPRWLATGLSQGGNAAYFAAAVGTERAPELDYRGAVPIAGPTQLDTLLPPSGPVFPPIAPSGYVGYVMYILAGLNDQRPDLNVPSYLTPRGLDYLNAATTLCGNDFRAFREANPVVLRDLLTRPLDDPAMNATLREMQAVPVAGYDRPLLVTQSLVDQTVPAPLTFVQTARMSAAGTDHRLVTFPDADHVGTLMASMPAALDFARTVIG
ncbi:lipase family protein [Rhodococcoides kroppenstedtii]|uniref:lipase family protein n=1 Tax=Rhodococcoides kroppenstedtii TaxID=293050 RepID=UPI001427A5B6|nr:hypothetical protein [Rhodococcus kroppenstedtii]